ncbi:MAG TPA: dTMP kinase [Actinomycetes bacterium]|nr:dTMP kinase [Actinomycetes bacterium]
MFVTIDGPGGVGKSTLTSELAAQLARQGVPVHPTTEPSPSPLGDLARHAPEHYRGLTLACLVAADRYWHLETEIQPHLAAREVVISDRYVPTSMVLQRIDGVDRDFIWQLNRHAPPPDLAVILRADPTVLAARLAARGPHTRFERAPGAGEVESRLYQQAAERLEAAGWSLLTVDSTRAAPEEIATTVLARILTLRENLQPR